MRGGAGREKKNETRLDLRRNGRATRVKNNPGEAFWLYQMGGEQSSRIGEARARGGDGACLYIGRGQDRNQYSGSSCLLLCVRPSTTSTLPSFLHPPLVRAVEPTRYRSRLGLTRQALGLGAGSTATPRDLPRDLGWGDGLFGHAAGALAACPLPRCLANPPSPPSPSRLS